MPHIDVPIWLVAIILPLLFGVLLYNWRRITKRLDEIRQERTLDMEKQAEKGGVMTIAQHQDLCKNVTQQLADTVSKELKASEILLSTKMDNLKENFDLKLDNIVMLVKAGSRAAVRRESKNSRPKKR
jgi:hypothetical protein